MTPLSQSKPWVALGVSRATWYRRRKPTTAVGRRKKPALDDALAVVKAAGFRISKPKVRPKVPKRKDRAGPTFVAEFADGVITRMTTFTSLTDLDWARGERLSRAAYESRWRAQYRKRNGEPCPVDEIALVPPAIRSARFEQNGVVLAERNGGGVA
jgi:hypothetical protein